LEPLPIGPPTSAADPRAVYRQRLAFYQNQAAQHERRLAWTGNLRFALLVLGFVLFWPTVVWHLASPLWLVLPAAVFAYLSLLFEQASRRNRSVQRALSFYERGLARLEGRWAGAGPGGDAYLDAAHPYAADLDLFGTGSVFERLCDARTRGGRDTLARWLCAPAPADEVQARQAAVGELRDRLPWRERFALLAADVSDGIDTASLTAWGNELTTPPSPWARRIALCLVALTLTALGGYGLGWWNSVPLAFALLIQSGFALWVRPRVRKALAGVRGRGGDVLRLAGMVRCLERETFAAPRLRQFQESLCSDGVPPSQRLADLVHLLEWLDATRNILFAVVAPFLLWTTRMGLAVELWRWHTGPTLPRWLTVITEMEALASLASYAYENPEDVFPELVADGPLFDAAGLGHPLLPDAACVRNDVALDRERRLLIVSGSNMSGKSTFLRTVGVNAVLALAGAPVRATRLRLSPLAVGASLRNQDSLQAGRSRFYTEITRLKEIVERGRGPLPVLFLLDEILHGTNSHDRRIGAEAVIRTLLEVPSIGLVTTHDLALAEIAERLGPVAANVHFADELVNGAMHFDYRLHHGVVRHSNALALMRAVGLWVEDGIT
jgi:hypothetical protein